MFESRFFDAPSRLLRDFGGQVAISIAASAVAAAFLALPEAIVTPTDARAPDIARPAEPNWSSPVAPDGKIRERHHDAVGAAMAERTFEMSAMMPAPTIMPMAIQWVQAPFSASPRAAIAEVGPVASDAQVVRRPAVVAERPRALLQATPAASPPLQLIAQAQPDASRPPALIGRIVSEPVARAGGLVSGAAGLVGAAGSWTVSQASNLLPRW